MILSVSRRTDIPAFYPGWFMNRVRAGYVLVRNPMNYYQVSQVSLDPDVTDCIVFWTKDAGPMLPYIDELTARYGKRFYFQFTVNAYGSDIEPGVPAPDKRVETFLRLSEALGPERVIWRYDPVLLTDTYTVDWHRAQFERTAQALRGLTRTCVFSFIDIYPKVVNNIKGFDVRTCAPEDMDALAQAFAQTARANGLTLRTCAEGIDLDRYGISHGSCVDRALIEALAGCPLKAKKPGKDKNQRAECGCLESIDIGQYNTCRHGCRYCYANFNPKSVASFSARHDDASPFLVGNAEPEDKVTVRKMESYLEPQQSFLW